MPTESCLIELPVEVKYDRDEPFSQMVAGKYFPITIKRVYLRGEDIHHLLHVEHIAALQRKIFFSVLEENRYGLSGVKGAY